MHNFGHHAASLSHILGTMTKSMHDTLKYDDKVSISVAKRKHIVKEGGKKNYRKKRNTDDSYDPGCEPI